MRTTTAVIALLTLFAARGAAQVQVEYPADLEKVAPFYPGANITAALSTPEAVQAHLETPDGIKKVVDFYKEQLAGKGWSVEAEMAVGDGMTISWSKGEKTFSLIASSVEGKLTTVVLSLNRE